MSTGMPSRIPVRVVLLEQLQGAALVLAAVAFLAATAGAEEAAPPKLDLPVRCVPGDSCWLVNLVDLDPGKGVRDYRCGRHAYDGHKGTDIAIRDRAAMADGVDVIAAAPGTVRAVRDGMADRMPDAALRRRRNIYCGNGIVIDHPGGWQTQYCHLRRGSVAVAKGDEVTRGQRLGYVGHSGMAEFPPLHLSVRRGAKGVDPFVGPDGDATACEAGPAPLWTAEALRQLAPPLTAVYNAGFAPTRPKPAAVRKGLYHAPALSRRAPALILWAEIFWVRPGDTARLRILGPDGGVVAEHSNVLPKRQARRMIFAGRKKPGLFWPAGEYTGEVVVERLSGDGRTRRFVARRSVVLKD